MKFIITVLSAQLSCIRYTHIVQSSPASTFIKCFSISQTEISYSLEDNFPCNQAGPYGAFQA